MRSCHRKQIIAKYPLVIRIGFDSLNRRFCESLDIGLEFVCQFRAALRELSEFAVEMRASLFRLQFGQDRSGHGET